MIPVIAAAAVVFVAAALALGHIAHPRRVNATTPGTPEQDRAAIEEFCMPDTTPAAKAIPAPALDLPAIAVPCPSCKSRARELCSSHGGTRSRRNDVHQARTAQARAAGLLQ
ncbi:hypothetical protein [Streptomyces sp. NPDC091416]|uniref:zinc finger domain-containing protein n=1 Tax=Streptomyces sp. NPDC091416 TaxID=3366003 RepID=UPI00382FFB00